MTKKACVLLLSKKGSSVGTWRIRVESCAVGVPYHKNIHLQKLQPLPSSANVTEWNCVCG